VIRRGVLAALIVLAVSSSVRAHPEPPEGFESALIGLLEMPLIDDLQDPSRPKRPTPERLDVRERPSASARIVATIDRHGLTTRDGARCPWRGENPCLFHESDYEESALAVFEKRVIAGRAWYRVAIDRGGRRFGWLESAAHFHTMRSLIASSERLTYLTPAWLRTLYPWAGATVVRPAKPSRDFRIEQPYRPLQWSTVGGVLWVEVELLEGTCLGEETVIDRGWVPVRNPFGRLNAWYSSRGC